MDCFDRVVAEGHRSAKGTANICINDVFAVLNKQGVSFVDRYAEQGVLFIDQFVK